MNTVPQDAPPLSVADLDRDYLLHPLSELRRDQDRHLVVGGEGIRVHLDDGRTLIDGLSGLWNILVGHGRQEICAAATAQMQSLAYYPAFWGYTSEPAAVLAKRLADLVPAKSGIRRFLFTLCGSDANEMNFRIARQYHAIKGNPDRQKILSRRLGYHGITRGAASATRIDMYHWFDKPDPLHVEVDTHDLDDLEATIEREGADTIAGFVVEPVIATGGVIPPRQGYFEGVRELCDQHDILLIFDEVVTAFGRTGSWFAMDWVGAHPDLLTLSKGITSGYLPLGAAGVGPKAYDVLRNQVPEGVPFMAGQTLNNHQTCCAAALANIDIIESEGLVENSRTVGAYLLERLREAFVRHPDIEEVRGAGLMAGIAWRRGDLSTMAFYEKTERVSKRAFDGGLIVRSNGDTTMLAPPLCTTREDVDEIVTTLRTAIAQATS
ncbi:MAG: aspartate aminotransferase family protein [Gammaproteobacteria bacterium]|nr:aspartate aminotransferase family protein [Gammaproteobacteria bacterium]